VLKCHCSLKPSKWMVWREPGCTEMPAPVGNNFVFAREGRVCGKWLVLLDSLTFQSVVLTVQSCHKLSMLSWFIKHQEYAILYVQFTVLCIANPLVILPYTLKIKIPAAGTRRIVHVFCPTKAGGTESSNEYITFC